MEAFQFITKAKSGNIQIPKQYLGSLKEEFTVIILVQKKEQKIKTIELKAVKIKTKGFKFDREEAIHF